MLDLASLFISVAHAADEAAPVTAPVMQDASLVRFLPFILILGVFYFLIIRPQQKKIEEQSKMIKALKKGDKVYIGSGIVGSIHKIEDDEYALVEVAKDVHIKVLRASISGLVSEKKPEQGK